ncbi:MAG: hypothetical protein ACR2JC_04350 [Chloroflexota bacterium]|nr:MAG: hypothetical protein DLM70_15525 [Chloroflexota bacterium]
MWTSADGSGHPTITFDSHTAIHLLAAWHLALRGDLRKAHLAIRWDVYRGYQRDLSLLPLSSRHVTHRNQTVKAPLQTGTFRLSFTPTVRHVHRGWYSLSAKVMLYARNCPPAGCSGEMRQSRFFTY